MSRAVALPDKRSLIPLVPGVWFFFNANGMSNAGVLEDEDGLTVIDTLLSPAMALDFLRMVREASRKPVRRVILTHFHGDHILGAEAFAGACLIAHENTRRWIEALSRLEAHRGASVVPGHGPVGGVEELGMMRRLLEELVGLVRAAVERGAGEEEVLAIQPPESVRHWPGQELWQMAVRRAWEEATGRLAA